MAERGWIVEGWQVPQAPGPMRLEGRFVRLEPLGADHAAALHAANQADAAIWDYLPYGPFDSEADYAAWLARMAAGRDPLFFALVDQATGQPGGVASFLRITPESGSIEVGHICLAPVLQRTAAASEAIFLMAEFGGTILKTSLSDDAEKELAGELGN